MNELLKKDFKSYLEEVKNPLKIIEVSFYEWSNIDSTPRIFKNIDLFKNFLNQHSISFTEKDIDFINKESICHAACPKNEASLLLTKYKYELRNALNGNPITTPRPTDPPTSSYYSHGVYGYDEDDSYTNPYNYYDYD